MTRVLIAGVHGRMGVLSDQVLQAADGIEVVGGAGRNDDLGELIQATGADAVLDFTRPDAVGGNVRAIVQAGAHPVVGTSGIEAADLEWLEKECEAKQLGGLVVPNFAIGAVLMMRLAEQAAHVFSDVEIIESHHAGKKDAPSGTARATAQRMASHQARSAAQVPTHSVRLPGLIAEQQVLFGGEGETLSITHRTYDRHAFAAGIVLACRKVSGLGGLVVGLESLLFASDQP